MRTWVFKEDIDGEIHVPDEFPLSASEGRAVALGYFDGVHRGHLKLFSVLREISAIYGLQTMAHTFSQTPKSKVFASAGSGLITTLSERCELIHRAGVDEIAVFPFSTGLASMRAETFLDEYVRKLLKAKIIVVGEDYRFGAGREGDVELIFGWAKKNNVQAVLVPPETQGDKVISSSWIRSCISEGDMETACLLLGRPVSYEGLVLPGRRIGRSLGFPTANIGIPLGKIVPQYGVYASFLLYESRLIPSVSNIGIRPTVDEPDVHPMIETHMHNVDLDLYGKIVKIFPVQKIRNERKFSSMESLRIQVENDKVESIRIHKEIDLDYSKLIPGVVL